MLSPKQTKTVVPVLVSMLPMFAMAAPVELRSPDGFISINGEITSFDGNMITVATSVGDVRVPASEVTCHGETCPAGIARGLIEETITIAGINPANTAVVSNFLRTTTASSSRSAFPGSVSLTNDAQNQIANVSFASSNSGSQSDVTITDVLETSSLNTTRTPIDNWMGDPAPTQLLAIKALSVVVSPGTGVDSVSVQQLAQIYAGEITNWSEIGGIDSNITPIQAAEGTRLHADVQASVLTPAGKPTSPTIFTMADAGTILKSLQAIPGAISIVPSEMTDVTNTLHVSNGCGVTSQATDFAVRAGDYPLTLSTLAVYEGELQTNVMHAAFDKAATQAGQTVDPTNGYASHVLMSLPNEDKNWRVANIMSQQVSDTQKQAAIDLIQLLFDARQLSATFADGALTQTQGAWTRAHFIRLRDAVMAGEMDGQDVVFVGFDGHPDETQALAVSQTAAENILIAFTAFAPNAANREGVSFVAKGHGKLAPVGCFNNGAVPQSGNRIEVWVRPAL